MAVPEYEYTVEQCDVPKVRRAALAEYRVFRSKCLEYMRGASVTSVTSQVHSLTWHTAVFRTLNEARRLEPKRAVNGPTWDLITDGYANLMTLGIRRLVDKDPRTDSLWNVIAQIEKRSELLTREKFICYDGLPYDYQAVYQRYIASLHLTAGGHAGWIATRGPDAWGSSEMMHKAFDVLSGNSKRRKRTDAIQPPIVASLRTHLSGKAIELVCDMADRVIAHAERVAEGSDPLPSATYNDIDEALRQIVRVTNYLSSFFFYDTAIGSAVPTPQFNVLEALDEPWAKKETIPALHQYWHDLCDSMDDWLVVSPEEFAFAPPRPNLP